MYSISLRVFTVLFVLFLLSDRQQTSWRPTADVMATGHQDVTIFCRFPTISSATATATRNPRCRHCHRRRRRQGPATSSSACAPRVSPPIAIVPQPQETYQQPPSPPPVPPEHLPITDTSLPPYTPPAKCMRKAAKR
jgi:hypothetical protein